MRRVEGTSVEHMLFFVIGPPSHFTNWCIAVTARLARRVLVESEIIEANTLEDIAKGLIGRGTTNCIVCSSSPGGHLRSALIETGRRVILVMDDPRRALGDLLLTHEAPFADALRRVASSCAVISGVQMMPNALTLLADRDSRTPRETVLAISRHLGIALDDAELDNLLRDTRGSESGDLDPETAWNSIDDHDRQIAEGALRDYITVPVVEERPTITWAPELFWAADQPGQPLSGPVDITGRARCLIEGPKIRVKPGCWLLSLVLALSPEAAEHEFSITISGCEPTQQHVIRANANGRFEGSCEVEISDAAEYPINVQVASLRAAFDGAVHLIGATLVQTLTGAEPPQTHQREIQD